MKKFKSVLLKPIAIALVVAVALTSAIPVSADNSARREYATNDLISASVQVTRDPALLAMYDETSLGANPYYNEDSLIALLSGIEQSDDQEAYFNNLPKEAQKAIVAAIVNSEYSANFEVIEPTRGGIYPTVKHEAIQTGSLFNIFYWSYSLFAYYETNQNGTFTFADYYTAHNQQNGYGFKGECYNTTSGIKNGSEYWVQTGARFDFIGFSDYVTIEITVYADGVSTPKKPFPALQYSEPGWWTLVGIVI